MGFCRLNFAPHKGRFRSSRQSTFSAGVMFQRRFQARTTIFFSSWFFIAPTVYWIRLDSNQVRGEDNQKTPPCLHGGVSLFVSFSLVGRGGRVRTLWRDCRVVWEEDPDALADLHVVVTGKHAVAVGYGVPDVCLAEAWHVVISRDVGGFVEVRFFGL